MIKKAISVMSFCFACSTLWIMAQETIVATYEGGSITTSEVEDWLWFNNDESGNRALAIQELALQKAWADYAVENKLIGDPSLDVAVTWELGNRARRSLLDDLHKKSTVPDSEIEKTFQYRLPNKDRPRKVRLLNLYKRFPANALDTDKAIARKELEAAKARLEAGEAWAVVAMEVSDSQTRFNGGILGNVKAGHLPPAVDEIVLKLKPGEFSDILEGKAGLSIFYCERIIPAQVRTAEQFRKMIAKQMKEARFRKKRQEFLDELEQKSKIAIDLDKVKGQNLSPDTSLGKINGQTFTVAHYDALLEVADIRWKDQRPKRPATLKSYAESQQLIALWNATQTGQVNIARLTPLIRRQNRAAAAYVHLLNQRVERPDENLLRSTYERFKDKLTVPEAFEVSMIQFARDENNLENSFDQVYAVRKKLKNGDLSMAEAARKYSFHPSAKQGGSLGWKTDRELSGLGINVARAAKFYKAGGLSKPIDENGHLFLIQVNQYRERRLLTFEEAKPRVEAFVGNLTLQEFEDRLTQTWIDRIKVQSR